MAETIFGTRLAFVAVAMALLAGCSAPADQNEPARSLGDFKLGFNVVVADAPEIGPFSREATDEELEEALKTAVQTRFGSLDGDHFYHIGIKVDAYALAVPGVPLVFSPKSVLVLTVNLFDDELGRPINPEPKAMSVFEGTDGKSLVGSGLTQNKQQQLARLSANAARQIEDWIRENPEWVGLPPLTEESATAAPPAAPGADAGITAEPLPADPGAPEGN